MKKPSLSRWLPAVIMMAVILAFSSIPSSRLPEFGWADQPVKKGGHMIGFGLLALAFLRALGGSMTINEMKRAAPKALLLTILYAAAGEYYQLIIPGRRAALLDVGLDAVGAAVALWIWIRARPRQETRGKT